MKYLLNLLAAGALLVVSSSAADIPKTSGEGFKPLFPKDGVPEGWSVRDWADVKNPPPQGAVWKVTDGVLHGSEPRGTWLISEKLYGDFILKFEFKLGDRGNSGCGLRFPGAGDPAFDGLELQMVDPRYFPSDQKPLPSELTGSLYRAVEPAKQVFKPNDWNTYEVALQGNRAVVILNGEKVVDTNLHEVVTTLRRHNGKDVVPMKERPLKGHIGFQELSRGGDHVQIRNARIKEL
jgi:Domain of Unknown Function (DUF1080)